MRNKKIMIVCLALVACIIVLALAGCVLFREREAERVVVTADDASTGRLVAANNMPAALRVFVESATSRVSGSGFYVNKDGYAVTNAHVVDSSGSIYVEDYEGGTHSARVLYSDASIDIAVLKVDVAVEQSFMKIADSEDPANMYCGDVVYFIGNPSNLGLLMSSALVSSSEVYLKNQSGHTQKSILLDGDVNHGNSGGGLFNTDGSLLGIVNARNEASGIRDFGYAIPVNLAVAVAQNIIDNSRSNDSMGAYRATLGTTVQVDSRTSTYDEETGSSFIVEKISVMEVTEGAPADGKLQEGDVIKNIRIENGLERTISNLHTVTTFMFNVRKGDTVVIGYERDGVAAEARITYDKDEMFTLFA